MQQKTILLIAVLLSAISLTAQQLPIGTCGIVNVYDAAGNRTRRVYFCNNGSDPYPMRQGATNQQTETVVANKNETTVFQEVDALFPNPTTGKFVVTFSKLMANANISITDIMGKVIAQFKGNGNRIEFDLFPYAAGIYFIRIEENGKQVAKKIVKQ